nr:BLTX500 [Nephila pilipes]
MEHGVKL